ncbi:hypothetical protein TNIN_208491 [Trichonephila inaurata madagascariensis]|uniref:Uncharacterized protein n=1 Tax=Trichonephila inaurata madagascariensis TaxID=2747483 RepID=A0A8X7CNI0_9ARAC|nr:hypothetical protein TNIN_208491 [Trichonephila inaurata madagascariensis]
MYSSGMKTLSNLEVYVLPETQMRDGMYFLEQRYTREDNQYLSCYNARDYSDYVISLDVNNMHSGFCISERLLVIFTGFHRRMFRIYDTCFLMFRMYRYSPSDTFSRVV